MKDDRVLQARAESLFEEAKAAEIFAAHPSACLDLEGDDQAVIAFEHEVYLVTGLGLEVTGYRRV